MSHRPELLAPVPSVVFAERAAAHGAAIIDTGDDAELIAAIKRAGLDVLVCGPGPDADLTRDAAIARRTGAVLLCDGVAAAAQAGLLTSRTVVKVAAREVAACVRAGWMPMVDVDEPHGDGGNEEAARAMAAAAVCVWQGAHVIRTRHVLQVRRSLDMTESVRGTRPPAWAVRGLA
jgi:hypothetical protein